MSAVVERPPNVTLALETDTEADLYIAKRRTLVPITAYVKPIGVGRTLLFTGSV